MGVASLRRLLEKVVCAGIFVDGSMRRIVRKRMSSWGL